MSTLSNAVDSITAFFGSVGKTSQNALDRVFPSDKRAEAWANLQTFAIENPKLAAFLTAQIALTGLPLLLFFTFSLTVFLFSFIAIFLVSLVAALLLTVLLVGVALVVVLPVIFLTTFAASFFFLWGLGVYHILKWVNEGNAPGAEGTRIGDKFNSLTGGRMNWLVDGAQRKQNGVHISVTKPPKTNGYANGITNGTARAQNSDEASNAPNHGTAPKDTAPIQAGGVQK